MPRVRGDVEAILDTNGNEVASYSYDVWGVPTATNPNSLPNPFLYQGAYGNIWDSEIELYYMNARHYDPSIGRFITQDREHGTLTNTMSQNLYIYCYNNPYGYKDPSGFTGDPGGSVADGTPIFESGYLSEEQQEMYDKAKEVDPELTIDDFLVFYSDAFNISKKMQKYDQDKYNEYDFEIAFWVSYWNDKAKLGLTNDQKLELANWIKATAYIDSYIK
ncbi:MAG TPA: RHS repeat-associated core domain-containing protein [Caldisericia bacterium]|nr:RHS repeat-associated core domain-containing protein [Caldisericia bacterium]